MFLLLARLLRKRFLLNKYIGITPLALLGVFIGAFGFGVLSNSLNILKIKGVIDWEDCINQAGIVYLGGLLGGLGAIRIACFFKERDFRELSDILGIVIPLFHGFGRIGCFFAGCCYGVEYAGIFALPYRIGVNGDWVMRFPTQLLEATFEFVLFVALFTQYRKDSTTYNSLLRQYVLCYCIFRFIIEFWRGDEVRGIVCGISFSQVICIVVMTVLLVWKLIHKRKDLVFS